MAQSEMNEKAKRIIFIHGMPASGQEILNQQLVLSLRHRKLSPKFEGIDGTLEKFIRENHNKQDVFISERFPLQEIRGNNWNILESAHHYYIDVTDDDAHLLMRERGRKKLREVLDSTHHHKAQEVVKLTVDIRNTLSLMENNQESNILPWSLSCVNEILDKYHIELGSLGIAVKGDKDNETKIVRKPYEPIVHINDLTHDGREREIATFKQTVIEQFLIKELQFGWQNYHGDVWLAPRESGRHEVVKNRISRGMSLKEFESECLIGTERIGYTIMLEDKGRVHGEIYPQLGKERR